MTAFHTCEHSGKHQMTHFISSTLDGPENQMAESKEAGAKDTPGNFVYWKQVFICLIVGVGSFHFNQNI